MPSKKVDSFLEGFTGKTKEEREADEKKRKARFSGVKKFFGMGGDEKPKPKSKKTY